MAAWRVKLIDVGKLSTIVTFIYVFYISRLLKRTPEWHAVPSNTPLSTHVQCFSVETCIKMEIKSQKQQNLYYLGNLPEPSKNPKIKSSIGMN